MPAILTLAKVAKNMSEEVAAQKAERWDVPAIDGSDGKGYLTAGRLEDLQKDAYDEAWKEGHAEGLAAGKSEITDRAGRYDELLRALSIPFEQLDGTVEAQLVELCIAIVKQLFRREINLDPTHVIGVVSEAIQALPIASNNIEVHLHPDDAALVLESLSPSDGEPGWSIVEEPLMARGGCNVTTSTSRIDASTSARLDTVINEYLGDERRQ